MILESDKSKCAEILANGSTQIASPLKIQAFLDRGTPVFAGTPKRKIVAINMTGKLTGKTLQGDWIVL